MPYLAFTSPTPLDLRLLTTFGASAKPGPSPIGKFGTGLKYAIAGAMRLQAQVFLILDGKEYEVVARDEEIRGKSFPLLYLSDSIGRLTQLPFTQDLGAHWEPWMIYRELLSNSLDEGGEVRILDSIDEAKGFPTAFILASQAFLDLHQARATFFFEPEVPPIFSSPTLAIYPGPAENLFFRGIKVTNFPAGSVPYTFTYSFLGTVGLSEDRLISSPWVVEREIVYELLQANPLVWDAMVQAEKKRNHKEWRMDFDIGTEPNEAFFTFWLARLHSNGLIPVSIRNLLKKWRFDDWEDASALEIPEDFEEMEANAPKVPGKITASYYEYSNQVEAKIKALERAVEWWKACAKRKMTGEVTKVLGDEAGDEESPEIAF